MDSESSSRSESLASDTHCANEEEVDNRHSAELSEEVKIALSRESTTEDTDFVEQPRAAFDHEDSLISDPPDKIDKKPLADGETGSVSFNIDNQPDSDIPVNNALDKSTGDSKWTDSEATDSQQLLASQENDANYG